jgi:ferritin-like metal-binding protein YciE
MPATQVSNPRDLLVQLLGELLFVERRLADCVLEQIAYAVSDGDLHTVLEEHRLQTKRHAERIENLFRTIGVAATSNLSRPFESAVAQHEELQTAVNDPTLADVFHAQAALHTEHWEIAAYTSVITLGQSLDLDDALEPLRDSLKEEETARDNLARTIARLSRHATSSLVP